MGIWNILVVLFYIIVVPFLFIGGVIAIATINGIGASDGEHTGVVTAVEHNDNLIWDANIVYFKTDPESTQEDKYCVNDLKVMEDLKEYAKNRELITIHFKNPFWFMAWDCNGGISIITEVKE